MESAGVCEMCEHHVGVRQKVHIVAEEKKKENNILVLCPTCRIMFDTHLKPKVFTALLEAGLQDLPKLWKKSIRTSGRSIGKGLGKKASDQ
jgi:hypothetical protein